MMEGIIRKIKENRVAYGEGIYLLYFAIMAGARSFGLLEGTALYTIILVLGMLLFGLKVVVTEHTITEYGLMAACMFVASMVYLHSGEKGLIVCFSMMFGMKAVSKKKVINVGIVVVAIMIILRVLPVAFGLTDEIYYPQERAGVGLMFRHSLGYAHPNTLHMNILMLSLLMMYITTFLCRRLTIHGVVKKKSAVELIVIASVLVIGLNLYVFQYSGSRTGLLACIVYVVCNLWLFCLGKTRLFEKTILYLSFPMACFLSIVIPLTFPGNIVNRLNDTVFMGRYWLDQFFWKGNRPVLWGQRLVHPGGHGMTYGLDSAQMYLFLQLGVVAFVLISIITFGFMYYSIKANDLPELAVMATMLFIGLWEPLLYNLSFKNFSFVFIGYLLYEVIENRGGVRREEDIDLTSEEKKLGEMITNHFSLKKAITIGVVSIIVGAMAFFIYNMSVQKPSALYASREQGENGGSLEMEALYLTGEDINTIRTEGNLVVDYVDEMTPMYKYDEKIALMEYEKKLLV